MPASDCTDSRRRCGQVQGWRRPVLPDRRRAHHGVVQPRGVDKLQLSPDTIAKIFQRQIKKWNDAAIAADNPGVTLPDTDIVVAHRSDSSGTTDNFTKFLDRPSGAGGSGVWTLKSGSTVEWPTDTQAGNGNAGVAQIIQGTTGAIGYVDLADAKSLDLKFASVKNKAGKFVEPTLDGRLSRRGRHDGQPRSDVQRPVGRRRRRLPDHGAGVDPRVQEADR